MGIRTKCFEVFKVGPKVLVVGYIAVKDLTDEPSYQTELNQWGLQR
jgi:hypothetical protein